VNKVRLRRLALVLPSLVLATLAAGCSSSPSQLYVLNSAIDARQNLASAEKAARPAGMATHAESPLISVAVTVPDYLDRLEIVQRTGNNELKPVYSAQWGERLATMATRALAEDLMALLPNDEVVVLPSSGDRSADYKISVDFIRFESDAGGQAVAVGRWSITDRDGNERMSGPIRSSEQAKDKSYAAMAAAMSDNLATISVDIAARLKDMRADAGRQRAAR